MRTNETLTMWVSNCLFNLTPGLEIRGICGTIKCLRSQNASSDRANLEIIVTTHGGMVIIGEREKSPAAKTATEGPRSWFSS